MLKYLKSIYFKRYNFLSFQIFHWTPGCEVIALRSLLYPSSYNSTYLPGTKFLLSKCNLLKLGITKILLLFFNNWKFHDHLHIFWVFLSHSTLNLDNFFKSYSIFKVFYSIFGTGFYLASETVSKPLKVRFYKE